MWEDTEISANELGPNDRVVVTISLSNASPSWPHEYRIDINNPYKGIPHISRIYPMASLDRLMQRVASQQTKLNASGIYVTINLREIICTSSRIK